MNQVILSVLGRDRPGIIAQVTGVLFKNSCNLEDVSMTVLEGEFAMMMVVCLRNEKKKSAIERDFRKLEKAGHLTFFWKEIKRKLTRGEKHTGGSETYLISGMGKDRTGIVYQISLLLAKNKLNITDLNCKILGSGPRAVYALLLEADIPKKFPLIKIRKELDALGQKIGIDVRIKAVERIVF